MSTCGIATWALKGLVGLIAFFFFLTPAHGKQAGKRYYIYDNGQVHQSENPNVYVDKNGIPTLVIRRASAGARRVEDRTVYQSATTAFVSSKTQTNQMLEAVMNSPHRNHLVKPVEVKKEEKPQEALKPKEPAAREGKQAAGETPPAMDSAAEDKKDEPRMQAMK
ncbi:MAG: hypothetical protein KDD43_06540 [Bdellovibrionales bacterium]|nr:hypothetical protein [Bdellovibrionales bacterium]